MDPDAKYLRRIEHGERIIDVHIRRMRRKTLAIHVFADRPVELRAPLKCPWAEIEGFLASRRAWIIESLESLSALDLPPVPAYREGEIHHYLGKPYRLRLVAGRTRNVSVLEDTIAIRCREPDDSARVQAILEAFYRKEARYLLPQRVDLCRARFREALPATTIVVRKMSARWGSCSQEGELCFNSALLQKPLAAIDFVVTHELCHLKHFAHDKPFYRLMDEAMPDWRERERLLVTGNVTLQLDLF